MSTLTTNSKSPRIGARSFRTASRYAHMATAASVALLLYSPLGASPVYTALVAWFLFPLSGAFGIALWQQRHVLGFLNGRRT